MHEVGLKGSVCIHAVKEKPNQQEENDRTNTTTQRHMIPRHPGSRHIKYEL